MQISSRVAALFALLFSFVTAAALAAPLTPGNLVIYRVGDGATGLINTGSKVFIDEYTTTGALVQSFEMPSGASSPRVISSGTATSEGLLSRSADANFVLFTGYDAPIPTTGLAGTSSATVPRMVGRIDAAGNVVLTTGLTDYSTGNNPRGVSSTNGTDVWVTGGAGGIRYTTIGSTTSTQISTTVTNLRATVVADGQLYVSTSSGTAVRIGAVGTGTPTTSGQAIATIPGLATSGGSPYTFAFADLTGAVAGVDTLYVADDGAAGITKYSLVGGNWTSNGTIGVASDAYRGLVLRVSGTTVTLFATRKGGSGATGGGELVRLVDTSGYNGALSGTPTLLATAGTNTAFRGVAFAPGDPPAIPDLAVNIAGPGTATVGVSYNYVITVSNVGLADATGVAVNFPLPSGVSFVGALGDNGFSGVNNAGTVEFTGGSVALGVPATLTVTVNGASPATVTVPVGAVLVDPLNAIVEGQEGNNASTTLVSTVVSNVPNTAPTIAADTATTTNRLSVSPAGPSAVSGVINDSTDPARFSGIVFTVADAETAVGSLAVTATSSNQAVVPNGSLAVTGSGASRTVRITPTGVGYSTITVTVTDAGALDASYTIEYAASAAALASTRLLTGGADASTAIAIDANFMFVADDEGQVIRLYPRATSGAAVAAFDFTASLNLTDLDAGIPREVDIEAATRVGNRIYWLGSHSNSSSGALRVNRERLFATDVSGLADASTLAFVGYYAGLRTDLIAWDQGNGHGLGANALGLAASAANGVIPEAPGGAGFNIEGLVMAPDNTTAYISFRAPLQMPGVRTHALIVPVTNFAALVSGSPAAGPALFGAPILLDLGGRGIREIAKNAANEYLIVAGPPDTATGVAPSNFVLYTWDGVPATAPLVRTVNLTTLATGGSFESIVEVPNPLTASSPIQLLTDNGDTIFYGDTIIAKELPAPAHRKFRTDTVVLGGAITLQRIHAVQGTGTASPLAGQVVTIEGIVVGRFTGLSGFFVQEEDADADADTSTSEGIFVFNNTVVAVGDRVRITGTVTEFGTAPSTLTELTSATVSILANGQPLPTAATIAMPLAAVNDWERYEGMRVAFGQALTVTETFELARFGEVLLSSGGRLFQPTRDIDPNDNPASGTSSTGTSNVAAVTAARDLALRNQIRIDDASGTSNPATIPFWDNVNNTLRIGSTVDGLAGIMNQAFGTYRVVPQGSPTWTFAARPLTPPGVGNATLKVGSFNVLNYFNGDGSGGGFPTSRGAETPAEFTRQRAKTIAAIHQLGADIVGLMEMENDGSGSLSAIQDLVNGLNTVAGAGTWAVVPDPAGYGALPGGTDEIKPALIYKPAVVSLVGAAVAPNNAAFTIGRAPVAQTFQSLAGGDKFTVVVNHLKSKSASGATGADVDQGDGQGAYNAMRRTQATALAAFVNQLVIDTADSDVLVLGDLNAYEQEDPIDILRAAGLAMLVSSSYSYVFDGFSGSLDHAIATTSLAAKVTGADKWHINADEPVILDYNVNFKNTPGCTSTCTSPDYTASTPFRSSDHDPVLVGLGLAVTPGTHTLSVNRTGSGSGVVTSAPAGINCGATCAFNLAAGPVTLTATADAGSVFTGWTVGPCTAAGTCQFTLGAATSITASFALLAGSPAVTMSPTALDFGGQSMGTTTPPRQVSVINSGTGTLNITSIASSAQFAQTNDCGASLPSGGSCTVTLTATPAPAGGALNSTVVVNGTLTANTNAGAGVTTLQVTGQKSLAGHYYRAILGRAPDGAGQAFWESEAARLAGLGVNANEAWYVMAGYFFNSAEYLAQGKNDAQFVTDLYNTFFNRGPDAGGLNYWVGQINGGLPREVVLFSFMFSTEFRAFTEGIFGNTAARAEVDVVVDLFRGILNRLPDTPSFNYWLGRIRAAQCAGAGPVYTEVDAMSSAFIFNPEYNNRARNTTQVVTDLYYSFLRRGGDIGGVQYWINELNTSARDLNNVRSNFINNPEFGARVQAVIAAGCTP